MLAGTLVAVQSRHQTFLGNFLPLKLCRQLLVFHLLAFAYRVSPTFFIPLLSLLALFLGGIILLCCSHTHLDLRPLLP